MILNQTQDQLELRSAVSKFIDGVTPLSAVRTAMESELGYDAAVWRRLCGELAVPALAVSEEGGGAGFGMPELAAAMQEFGAGLVPGPLFGSGVLVAQVLDAIGDKVLLPEVVAGTKIAALVQDSSLRADNGTVTGEAFGVLDAMAADVFVVVAGLSVYAVDATADGVTRTALETLDPTRRQGAVSFTDAVASELGPAERVAHGIDRATVALAAEQVGVMERSVRLAVEYAKVREQFGRKIGSFQAVKQGLADIYASYELAASAVAYAAWVADNEPDQLAVAASVAKAYVGPQAFQAVSQMIQYHGGIGYTWEHDAHLFYKRAKTNETLLGTADEHLERIAAALLDD
ncbi:acyl-CoA dehydrogenase family protein [Aldersonia kunmingensis]|uniref:acyl-CoA dehydrogenase family protein n=1 Tax=Aldersonia kunmingensis TaxID=408066 RepID=UPI0008349754|nr:acyl-CoA dehydrogenase family protein [Aldersonia kunmingensis]